MWISTGDGADAPTVAPAMGQLLIVVGLLIAAIGVLVMAGVPFGRLPGDLVWRRGGATFYFPVVTSLILSLVLTVLLALFRR